MATTIEGALKAYVQAATAVSSIVSSRVYFLEAPQDPTFPYVVFFCVDDPHNALYYGGTSFNSGTARYQFSCFAKEDMMAGLNLQNAIINRLRWTTGTQQGFNIERITILDVRQRRDPDIEHVTISDVDARVEYYE